MLIGLNWILAGPWITFPTIQNHFEDVSSELGWLKSNGLGAKVIGHLDSGHRMIFHKLIF
jgi:hypothetical protein